MSARVALTATAYAKINLALHVRRRREDGYHELETLFAFCDFGDELSVLPSSRDELRCLGEFGGELADPFGNIVAQALNALQRPSGWSVRLEKRLPVAAGLGGGSADAGAIFRLIEREYGLPDGWQDKAARLGADVPACVLSQACVGRGTGTELEPVENDLAGTPVLLINPRVPLSTGPVFKAWDGIDRGPLPEGLASAIAIRGRNDLETPARQLCPQVGEVLGVLEQTGATLVRMSGSGATCFALYADEAALRLASERVASQRPDWWQMSGKLR